MYPVSDRPDLVLWALWSRNRNEEIEGVYSHETALRLYELSDVNPAKLHLTVPRRFRRNTPTPPVLVLHHGELHEADVAKGRGFRFTRPLRTILDVIEAGTVEANFIRDAIDEALRRGLIDLRQIRKTPMNEDARRLFEAAITSAA